MVDLYEIRSRSNLEDWFAMRYSANRIDAPQVIVTAKVVAWQAAARVVPFFWAWSLDHQVALKRELTPLPLLRCCLVASVASREPEDMLLRASSDAAFEAMALVKHVNLAIDLSLEKSAVDKQAVSAVLASANAAYAARSNNPFGPCVDAMVAEIATKGGRISRRQFWSSVQGNIVEELYPERVDHIEAEPSVFSRQWKKVRRKINASESDGTWPFWRWWLDSFFEDKLVSENDLVQRIARLPDAVWNDPKSLHDKINKLWHAERNALSAAAGSSLQTEYGLQRIARVIEANPLGHRVSVSGKTGQLTAVEDGVEGLPQVVKDLRSAIREFFSRCKADKSNFTVNVLAAIEPHLLDLRARIAKHKESPRELLRAVEETHRAIALEIRKEAAEEHILADRLTANLQDRAADICAVAPDVLAEVKRRRAVKAQLLTEKQISLALRLGAGMAADSEGVLQAAISQALIVIGSENAAEQEKAAAWTYLLGALPRGAKVKQDCGEEGRSVSKDTQIIETLTSHAESAAKIDKGVDAVQEAISEGGPWVSETITQIVSGNLWGMW